MKKRKPVNFRNVTAFMVIFLLLILCTACSEKKEEPKTTNDGLPSEQNRQDISAIPEIIPLKFSSQGFSNIPLPLLDDSQIDHIARSIKIDDMVTYVEYIPKDFSEENPEDYTHSYIELSGVQYILSHSLGETWHEITKTTLSKTDTIYTLNEQRGANYGVTIFFVIRETIPYIVSEIDGFAQSSDINEDGIEEIISAVGTVPETSIYLFDFEKQTIRTSNINEQSGAKYSIYDAAANTFRLAFEPNQEPAAYVYQTNEQLEIE